MSLDFKAVLFDLDGTLLDSIEDIADSMNNVLARNGYEIHELGEYRKFIGDGIAMLVKRALPDNKGNEAQQRFLKEYQEEYDRNRNVKTRPYIGIPEVLKNLNSRRVKIAVLSNKPDLPAKKCVSDFFPENHFEVVLGQKDEIAKKPDPEGALMIAGIMNILPEHILYVGDSDVDMKTAVSAGMYPAGALWGYRDMEELRNNGAKSLIKTPFEILELLHSGFQG